MSAVRVLIFFSRGVSAKHHPCLCIILVRRHAREGTVYVHYRWRSGTILTIILNMATPAVCFIVLMTTIAAFVIVLIFRWRLCRTTHIGVLDVDNYSHYGSADYHVVCALMIRKTILMIFIPEVVTGSHGTVGVPGFHFLRGVHTSSTRSSAYNALSSEYQPSEEGEIVERQVTRVAR